MAAEGHIRIHDFFVDFFKILGQGGFGTVYKGYDLAGNDLAVKRVRKSDRKKASMEANKFFKMKNVDHINVLKVYEVKTTKADSMWITMEHCDLHDLNRFFNKYLDKINLKINFNIMRQIAKGLAFLYHKKIFHRDIKPANILLKSGDGYIVVKLGDFGLSRFLDPDDQNITMSNVGTYPFKAPEMWNDQERVRYHLEADIYSTGMTYMTMFQAEPGQKLLPKITHTLQPSPTMPVGFVIFNLCKYKRGGIGVLDFETIRDIPQSLKWLIQAMTHYLPNSRPTAAYVEKRLDALARQVSSEK